MPNVDLRTEFARLCAAEPSGEADGTTYEEVLGLAVQRLVLRTRDTRCGRAPRPRYEHGSPANDCPFMVSVMTLPFERVPQGLR
ncbi:hypothetical protein [Methylobacterium sp. J-070]|uniref:hypothetical protein n=1 Tax=Methylobacterium sp. J-070 TaxID=2836650 RepID=UPI001FBBF119|nr:hypothetical protein [Methylobacterium sp. J-070]MCJ2052459.1 hypothetical protein [Methylobacterium sp. J-070]